MRRSVLFPLVALVSLVTPPCAWAHAIVGMRVFPGTLTFDDPGVVDELDLGYSRIKVPADNGTGAVDASALSLSYSKTLTPRLGISLDTNYQHLNPATGPTSNGFDNLGLGVSYQIYKNDRHETLAAAAFNAELGGSGSRAIANSYSTFSPTLLFGKGFGDLPGTLRYLRPLAVTGMLAPNITSRASAPNTLSWALSVQYSIPYLQSFVRDVGLRAPFNNMVPIVELPLQTCLNAGCGGQTTGTVNPGVIWLGRYGQVGVEAAVPVNHRSGSHVGVLLQVGFYLDDIFPHSLGKPLFQ